MSAAPEETWLEIELARRDYEESGNALHAWEALALARGGNCEIPSWVLDYLDRAGAALLAAAGDTRDEAARAVSDALGMARGRGTATVFADFADRTWRRYGLSVWMAMHEGDQETYAIDRVAREWGVSRSTVRRAWKRYQRVAELPPPAAEVERAYKEELDRLAAEEALQEETRLPR